MTSDLPPMAATWRGVYPSHVWPCTSPPNSSSTCSGVREVSGVCSYGLRTCRVAGSGVFAARWIRVVPSSSSGWLTVLGGQWERREDTSLCVCI